MGRRRPVYSAKGGRRAYDRNKSFPFTRRVPNATDDGRAPANPVRVSGSTRRPCRLDDRPRRGQLRAHRVELFVDGEPYGDLTRDDILDNITLFLVDEHRRVRQLGSMWNTRALSSTTTTSPFRPPSAFSLKGHPSSAELDRARLPQSHPFQRRRQRRALCRLGTAAALFQKRFSAGLLTNRCANRKHDRARRRDSVTGTPFLYLARDVLHFDAAHRCIGREDPGAVDTGWITTENRRK